VSWLSVLAAVMVVATYVRAIFFTPPEAAQGFAQKIYYIHVPSAIAAYLAFTVVAIASAVYLWLRDDRLDRIAESSAEVGVVFVTAVLTTGPFWARPIWGWWWVWSDMRLTLTLFMWFIYIAYLLLRGAIDDPGRRARFSAVLGILGALLIPFIHLSVYMFNNMHPMPIVLKPSQPSLPPVMLKTWLLGVFSFLVLYFAFLQARYRIATTRAARAAEQG
jgi:heme exporter protein C